MDHNIHKFSLQGLDCSKCALKIEKSLKENNYAHVQLNFVTRTLSLGSNDVKGINDTISRIEPGVQAVPYKNAKDDHPSRKNELYIPIQIGLSVILLIFGFILTQPSENEIFIVIGTFSFFLAYLIAGWKVLWKALMKFIHKDFTNEYFLMAVATLGAILIQEIPEASAVMIFYTIGEYLQVKAVNHSRRSITSLLDIRPDQAHLVRENDVITLPVEEINPGDIIMVKPGERIPLDGVIIKGKTTLDMSTLTGESRPVAIKPGMDVFSGTITSGSIHVQVTSPFHESTVSRILNAVENASVKKSKNELFITRFARYYTPVVLVAALFLAIIPPLILNESFNVWVYRALVILVISCPCALVVSIPLVYFSGIGKSSREGILLKGANVFDSLNNISTVLWDKTGTLTVGKFQVVTIIPETDYTPEEVLSYAALAEAHSTHPIAISIREAYGKPIDLTQVEEYEEIPALGIKMRTTSDDIIIVGNDKMAHSVDCPHSKCVRDETAVYVIKNGVYLGHIIIDDKIKENSVLAIERLKAQNVSKIGLMTGDTRNVAERVGRELGINQEEIFASLMPLNKLEILERYIRENSQGGSVIFVGDGINDAPVIARADVGVAMGGIGSDATIEAADLVIMDDDPQKLNNAIDISKRTNTLAKQNIIMALGIKAIFIILGAMGLASMWAAVFGDVGVTILTVLNSLRLLR